MYSQLVAGSTYRFTPNTPGPAGSGPAGETGVLKDGIIWDLTAAQVFLRLHPPDGAPIVELAANLTDAAHGLVEYLCTTTDLAVPGTWGRSWRFKQGAVDIVSGPPIQFGVIRSP